MGERGNICVKQAQGQVWFYTHWRGHEIKTVVQNALKKKERWDDGEYLARIIFDELRGDDSGTTGFGISTCMGDNSYPIVLVDCVKKAVFIVNEDQIFLGQPPDRIQGGILFSDFCEQTLQEEESLEMEEEQ
jgi:hypothetical protein